jgi:hypothetical protein
MDTETAPKKARKKSRRRRPRDETVYYVFEIKEWDWSFMFGVNPIRDRGGPYSDYRHLQLHGNLICPAKIKANEVELTFLPDHDLNEGERDRHEPTAVGSLHLYRGRLTGLLPVPSDALAPVLQMMIADRFRFVVLSGDRLRYGHAATRAHRRSARARVRARSRKSSFASSLRSG